MDDMDRKIVDLLLADGRLSHEQIGREIHLSRPAVFERVRRLEARRVIRGYGARVDWEALGLPLTAFVWIRTRDEQSSALDCITAGRAIARLQFEAARLEDLYRITGEWCFLTKYRLASPSSLEQVIDGIRRVPGVQGTLTSLALSATMEGSALQETAGEASEQAV